MAQADGEKSCDTCKYTQLTIVEEPCATCVNGDDSKYERADGEKSCETCKYGETFNLDCARCDDDMTNYAPKQADGDLISRQDAISEIREMAKWHTRDAFNADRVIQHLKQMPPVAIPSKNKCDKCNWVSNGIENSCEYCPYD